ncbi:hypothetical protein FL966_05990 [Caproiciproducens galactitolivorans]|uniref:DNA polymerase III subunit beta n=1 Tax=Caproiciproducens galactitolivorans TaxID=642589 RepID=A0A4Z0Y789_9FIRM|nr:hypothetical protein [Caproiciproducens galactitolivorans]QEY34640.1 hypothetical protein FL966_05990 [Caproiciproducens galactitolivorans]TGJ75395.1 DNA polymerase III subunit beta [Caproiciproducens galactitolivorans]
MTKFNVLTSDLKYIMSALRPAVSKTDCRPVHEYIKFECTDNSLLAYALDGYRLHSVTAHVDVTDGEKAFCFLLKPFAVPKTDSEFIPCELSEKEIMFNFGEQKITFKLGAGVESFIDVKEVMPKTPQVFKIGFNPQFLADAAKSLQTKNCLKDSLVMEFYGPLSPAKLYNSRNKSDFRIVLPVRLKEEN